MNRLVKAFSILEKYGCNLTSPSRPKFWRSVKHNNPVFRATVDAVKVGRRRTSELLTPGCSNTAWLFCAGRSQSPLPVRLHQPAGRRPQFPRKRLRTRQRRRRRGDAGGDCAAHRGGHADEGPCLSPRSTLLLDRFLIFSLLCSGQPPSPRSLQRNHPRPRPSGGKMFSCQPRLS